MSFLSSVLNSISKGESSTPIPPSRQSAFSRPSSIATAAAGVKRKADTELQRPDSKAQKTGETKAVRDIKPLPQRSGSNGAAGTSVKTPNAPKPGSTILNGVRSERPTSTAGTTKPSTQSIRPTSSSKPNASAPISSRPGPTPDPKKAGQPVKPGGSTAAGGAASTVQAQAQPKKGSFKDLMARAKAAQTVAVGKITHRSAEKMSKKDRLALAKGKPIRGKEVPPPVPVNAAGKNGTPRDAKGHKPAAASAPARYQGTSKPKAPAKPIYQGTAKPSAKPAYKGTSKPGAPSHNASAPKPARRADRNEYLGTDEEDEGEYGYDSEGDYHENSDDYSDMDAGFDEIDDEEEEAERQAKRDDVKEQKLLDKLAREKADKRKTR